MTTTENGLPYVLTPRGYGRRTTSGELCDELTFDGMPHFQRILDEGGNAKLSSIHVDALMILLAKWLKDRYDHCKFSTDWVRARIKFGGMKFEEFVQNPQVGKLPVSETTVSETGMYLASTKLTRGEVNLLQTIVFGEPVTLV